MSFKVSWSVSLPGQLVRGISLAIDNSALFNWYRGSDAFHELHTFRNSATAKILAYAGRGLNFLIRGTGQVLRFLVIPTATYQTLNEVYTKIPQQPVRLLSILGLSALVTNSLVMLVKNPHWSMRSIALRGGLALVLALGITVRVSWQQIGNSSYLVRMVRDLIWGD